MDVKIISNSDEKLILTPLSDGQPITENITKAIFTVGNLVLDSSIDPELITVVDGVFTIDFKGNLPSGKHQSSLRLFFAGSDLGTVVIDKTIDNTSLVIQGESVN